MYGWGCADLFHGSLREVMRVRSAGELIPIEGGNDPSINGALFKGIVQTACGTGSAVSRRDVHSRTYPTVELERGYCHFLLFLIFKFGRIIFPMPRSRAARRTRKFSWTLGVFRQEGCPSPMSSPE